MQLPHVDLPLTQRNAQLVIAREYGYAGWQDLTAEVSKRLGHGLEWAAGQAQRVIHDNERVKQWFDESGAPALGDVENHYPCSPYMPKGRVEEYAHQWGAQRE